VPEIVAYQENQEKMVPQDLMGERDHLAFPDHLVYLETLVLEGHQVAKDCQ
jgi:hypothetical protein